MFFLGAAFSASATYGVAGLLSAALPGEVWRVLVGIAVLISAAWYLSQRRVYAFTLRGRQARRKRAQRGIFGVAYFGALLGVGLLTEISTPLVLCGLASCVLEGPLYGLIYGAGFAFGRSAPAFAGAASRRELEPSRVVERLYYAHVGARIAAGLLATTAYALVAVGV